MAVNDSNSNSNSAGFEECPICLEEMDGQQVVKQLQNDRPVIRKRSAHCLGALVVVSSDALLNSLMQTLLDGIEQASATSQSTRTLIQTIGTISRTVGYRLSRHLERVVPLFLRFCGNPTDESQQTDAANELRESCFPGECAAGSQWRVVTKGC